MQGFGDFFLEIFVGGRVEFDLAAGGELVENGLFFLLAGPWRYSGGIEVDIFAKIIESGENKVAGKFLTG